MALKIRVGVPNKMVGCKEAACLASLPAGEIRATCLLEHGVDERFGCSPTKGSQSGLWKRKQPSLGLV